MAAKTRDERNLIGVTVILADSQPAFLDTIIQKANAEHDLRRADKLTRSHLLRAMIDGLESSGLDLTGAASETEIAELIAAAMKGRKERK